MPWWGIVVTAVAGTWIFVTLLATIVWVVVFKKLWKDEE